MLDEIRRYLVIGAIFATACDHGAGSGHTDGHDAATTADAATSETCVSGKGKGKIGDACGCQRDCTEGTLCVTEDDVKTPGRPHGTCFAFCESNVDDCGPGTACETVAGTDKRACEVSCSDDSNCRDGWFCAYGVCSPHCTDDAQCLSGHCDEYRNLCSDGSPRKGGGVQAECTRDEDCLSGACLTTVGGNCFSPCSKDTNECADGAVCVTGLDLKDAQVGICMLTCATSADCPGMLACLSSGGHHVCWRSK